MSLFRSLQTLPDLDTENQHSTYRPWPAVYRETLPEVNLNNFTLQVRIENQLSKTMDLKQLSLLPSFTENRNIYSKAGWVYQGLWKGISFQTLFSLFSTPHLYNWVRLESMNNLIYTIERKALLNYRIATSCDGKPIPVTHGGPVLAHCFDNYIEYSIPHLKSIVLMQGEHKYKHPSEEIGFNYEDAQVETGDYYAISQDLNIHFERPRPRF